jgi:hypothetical protein
MNGFPKLLEAIRSEYSLVWNICKQKFTCMRKFVSEYSLECEIRLEFCAYSLLNKYFEANFRQKSEYSLCSKYSRQNVFFLHQIEYLYANLCEYFEANMK